MTLDMIIDIIVSNTLLYAIAFLGIVKTDLTETLQICETCSILNYFINQKKKNAYFNTSKALLRLK